MCKCSQIRVTQGSSGEKGPPVNYTTVFYSCTALFPPFFPVGLIFCSHIHLKCPWALFPSTLNLLCSSIRNILSHWLSKTPIKTYCYPAITSVLHWLGSWTSILLLHLYLWKLEEEFPCIPSFYHLWLILKTWPSCIWEKLCVEAHWSCFCVNFCKHTEGPQQDLLNSCVVLFAFVCALRGLLIIITVLWCDDICCVRKKNIWAFQDVGQACFLLAEFVWAGNGDIIVVNYHWKKQ